MIALVGDIRLGARSLARSPGFTLVVVATLAFGIGLTTALFSLVDQLLLWSVPAREAHRLVKIEGGYSRTYPFFLAYRDLNQAFDGVLASSDNMDAGFRPAGSRGVEIGHVEYVSGGYFQVLGIGAAAGRVITPFDDTAGGPAGVVLSYRYWQRRFDGDLRVIGQQFRVNNYPLVIAGVAEKGFGGLFNGDEPDVFMTLSLYPVTNPGAAQEWNSTRNPWLTCVARLKPGVSIQQARASMPVLWRQAVERVNDRAVEAATKAHMLPKEEAQLSLAARAPLFIRNQKFQNPLRALVAVTVLVLLLTCANVANLLLVRASQRAKQTAVRLSLGATRGRLMRQFLTESLLLAVTGSAMGLGVAHFGVRALAQLNFLPSDFRFHLSGFVLASCAGLTLLTTILFGLMPALRATRMRLAESTNEQGMANQTLSRSLLSKFLIANQIALSLALLAGASLFGRTLRNLQSIDLGFQRESVAIFEIDPASVGYAGQGLRVFYDQFLERTRTLPGVRSAALAGMTPMGGRVSTISVATQEFQTLLTIAVNPVSSGYFAALGVPLLAGRDFRREDEPVVAPRGWTKAGDVSRVCILDQALARHQFGTVNAVGRRFCYPGRDCSGDKGIEVIGVVRDAHYGEITHADTLGMIYEPSWSNGAEARRLAVRFAGDATPMIASIRRALQEQDSNVPLLSIRLMEEYINSHLAQERLIAYLSSFFGILALGLAALGLFGVLACVVTQRTGEIGIRMALGARRGDVVRMVLRFTLVPVVAGLVVGTVVAFSWGILLGSLFYGIDTFDLVAVSQSVAVLVAAALLAAAIPARRAIQVDPVVALRHE
ncbi:ADOP family duplicated permease [uncultured Paludibaculum sp.]|uniref:ADOP family duplicated permease n=1 Tax=uncultured Paludibaculum sp. TaxID=1765020 RepID=UPI002AAA6AE7|nr:ADOP family duplicated permease [uncultured Paludibaculum sp.]